MKPFDLVGGTIGILIALFVVMFLLNENRPTNHDIPSLMAKYGTSTPSDDYLVSQVARELNRPVPQEIHLRVTIDRPSRFRISDPYFGR
jgi:hypothetical protein